MKRCEVYYQDHHSSRLDPASSVEGSDCLNWSMGVVVYEDDEWIRLCHEKTNLTEGNEDWGVTSIRKVDVTRVVNLEPEDAQG